MKAYEGQHIWIIGASSGIGKALAVELAAQGAVLALSARSKNGLDALNKNLGGRHHVFPMDISDTNAVMKTAQAIQTVFPNLDSVISMAAIYNPTTLDNLDMAETRKIVDVNLNGAFNIVYATLPIFKAQQSGQLALCGSVAGYRGLPGGQPYSATKAAVINLAESLKAENPHLDIKIINPGFVRTPLTDKNNFKMPMMIEPEEAAKAIANGLRSKCFEIHFPKRFTYIMKLVRFLPYVPYFALAKSMNKNTPRSKEQ
jgi:short-subunit dehydrogenase